MYHLKVTCEPVHIFSAQALLGVLGCGFQGCRRGTTFRAQRRNSFEVKARSISLGGVMSDESDHDFRSQDEAKAQMRAAIRHFLESAAGKDRGDIVLEIIDVVSEEARRQQPKKAETVDVGKTDSNRFFRHAASLLVFILLVGSVVAMGTLLMLIVQYFDGTLTDVTERDIIFGMAIFLIAPLLFLLGWRIRGRLVRGNLMRGSP